MSSPMLAKQFTIELADPSEIEGRAVRRVFIANDVLKEAKLYAGDPVAVVPSGRAQAQSHPTVLAVGVAWPSLDLSSQSIEVSSSLLLTLRVNENSTVRVAPVATSQASKSQKSWRPSLQHVREAEVIRMREVDSSGSPIPPPSAKISKDDKGKRCDWLTLLVRETLIDLKYMTRSQIVHVQYEGKDRYFSPVSVTSRKHQGDDTAQTVIDKMNTLSFVDLPPICTVGWDTTVLTEDGTLTKPDTPTQKDSIESLAPSATADAYSSVGGLDKQIAQIRDLIEIPLTRPDLFRHFGLKPPRGLLLHGPPGTGKTHLARAIASSTHSSVLIVNGPELSSAYHGETEASLRRVFADARAKAPCIIVLDEVDAICPRREDGAGGEVEKRVVATLLTEMDGVEGDDDVRVVVVATTNRPNAIDPALRRPGRFDREIEIGIPDLEARISILNLLLSKTPHAISAEELRLIASRAHGYVGADLAAVVREAGTTAIKRFLSSTSADATQTPSDIHITADDLAASLLTIRPSALRAHFLDMPPVHFSEIGGLDATIARLRESVEWPLKHAATLARLGVKAPRGVLLCGPPGCSKTVLVRATATESGVNFFAVRGPELLNKYVGESERAVREIFRKARAAAPSIIFFDEIDALASSRSSGGDAGSHEGVLTSLLNEMDGVEELVGVTIIAATNRPDVIDSALMRPGRLDRTIYVGPPDYTGRIEILRIRMRKMSVDPDIDLEELASLTDGCSGAEISGVCQEAALLAMQRDINVAYVSQEDFVKAAKAIKKQITPEMLAQFRRWMDSREISTGGCGSALTQCE